MAEYISKQDVIDYLNGYLHSLGEDADTLFNRGQRRALINSIQDILAVKAVDVQPVEKWCEYGFEYREPAEYGYYLTYYHGRIHVSEWSVSGWYNETGLPIDDDVVKYWQPLPEPPVTD